MSGTGPEHPVREATRWPGLDDWLDELDELLSTLDRVAAHRLDGKRRDFRALRDRQRLEDLLSEFVLARWLVERGVVFEFGASGTPQPDLVLANAGIGLEVTRRDRRAARELSSALLQALRHYRPRAKPVITLSAHPLTIRRKVLADIVSESVAALRRGDERVDAVIRPAREGYGPVTVQIDLFGGFSVLPRVIYADSASHLNVTLLDIEDLILGCLEDERKSKQGAAMPSVLVVDVSGLPRPAWLRPNHVWGRRLAALLEDYHAFSAVAVMLRLGLCQPPRFAMGIGRFADAGTSAALLKWGRGMGVYLTDD